MTSALVAWLRTVADEVDRLLIDIVLEYESALDREMACGHTPAQIEAGVCRYDAPAGLRLIAARYADWPGYRDEWKL